jgi:RNA polymerase sigma-70 factor (ECF subfamily)
LNEKEFLKLINQHSGIVHKIIYLYVDDPEDKNDLKQEIFLQAWKSIGNFRRDSQFSTWFYRVALNTALTYRKKDKNKLKTAIENYDQPVEERPKHEKSELLFRAIKQLNDVDKTIITLHLDDYDNGEISEITGMTKNNVAVKLHRIKEVLTTKLNGAQNG